MARKRKFREPTDVVSVRLPVSLIDRLDTLCQSLRVGRAEFLIALLQRYPELPSPKKARVWLVNLSFALVGGSVALLAALHGGMADLSERAAPARALTRDVPRLERGGPLAGAEIPIVPLFPLRDLRQDPNWRFGQLQYFIPRHPPPRTQKGSAPATDPGERTPKDRRNS